MIASEISGVAAPASASTTMSTRKTAIARAVRPGEAGDATERAGLQSVVDDGAVLGEGAEAWRHAVGAFRRLSQEC